MRILITMFIFSTLIYAQAMNPRVINAYEKARVVQVKAMQQIIRYNRLLKSKKLNNRQRRIVLKAKNNTIKAYKMANKAYHELEARYKIPVFKRENP